MSMKKTKVVLFNRGRVQETVTGNDGQVYYIPPRSRHALPVGVTVSSKLPSTVKLVSQQV